MQREGQILKAALEVYSCKGYAAATIPEIAKMAGVSVGTIYNYYPNKRELFIAVMKNLVITDPFLDIKVNIQEFDISDGFRQIIQNRLQLTEKEPGSRIPYLMSEILRDPELKTLWVDQSLQPFFAQMEEVYGTLIASGRLRQIDTKVAVRAVASLVIGFNMLKFLEDEKSPAKKMSQEILANALTDFLLHGLVGNIENTNT